jgi:hypothetical protein
MVNCCMLPCMLGSFLIETLGGIKIVYPLPIFIHLNLLKHLRPILRVKIVYPPRVCFASSIPRVYEGIILRV